MKKIRLLFSIILLFAISLTACFDDKETDEIYHTTFTVFDQKFDYKSYFGFTSEYGNYSSSWWQNEDNPYNIGKLYIDFPSNVKEGDVFDKTTSGFSLSCYDAFGYEYGLDANDSSVNFTLTITRWEGTGGTASGTFSGILKTLYKPSEPYYDYIEIKNGKFECPIDVE